MQSRKPRSRQEAIQQKRQSTFVGREQQLEQFRYNLALPPEDWCFLFNIWGQGGVGKSTLLRQFRKLAEHGGCITAAIDEGTTSVPETMWQLAEQLEQQGYPLKQFSERYRVFRQKKQELETDPEAPQGFSVFLGRTVAKAGLGLAKQIPGSGAVTPFLDEEAITLQASQWAAFVAKRLTNKDEVRLVQEPEAVLSPLFLQELSQVAEQVNLLLAFDTYERTSDFLDDWLREVLAGQHGELPLNLLLVIAGREQLDPNHWSDYKDLMAQLPLNPFTEAEAKQYLASKNITEPKVMEVIWQLSQGLPVLVAMLASNSPTTPEQVGEPSGTAVERFLKWETEPKRRQVALDAALCRCLNRDLLALIVGEEEADVLFQWLTKTPFVEERSDGWAYHDIVRTQMLRYKRRTSPQNWAELHSKLADYYEKLRSNLGLDEKQQWNDVDWQKYTLNWLHHYLCQSPQQRLSEVLNQFFMVLQKRRKFAEEWAELLIEAGEDREFEELRCWGRTLLEGLNAFDEERYEVVIQMWSPLFNEVSLEPKQQSITLAWRGDICRLMERYEEALQDLNHAIELNPSHIWAITSRGATYTLMERYEEALQDLNRAIELDTNYAWAIARRGFAYQLMQRYEEALQDLSCAVELNPNYVWAIAQRGATYTLMERYEEALQDLNRAIELNTNYVWVVAQRGMLHKQMGQDDKALADFNCVIALIPNPSTKWDFQGRGAAYFMLKQYQEALMDFNRAIELYPSNYTYLFARALTYQALDQPSQAEVAFDQAIQMAHYKWEEEPQQHKHLFNLAFYQLAAGNTDRAKQFYQEAINREATTGAIQTAIRDLEDFLNVLPQHPMANFARQAKNWLKKQIPN